MTSQIPYGSSIPSTRNPSSIMDDAIDSDSGYGGSFIDNSSNDSENLFERSFSAQVQPRHQIPMDRQEEIYQENCRLLTGSIEDAKHILKVTILLQST
jgi:hypothetical protein